MLSPARAQGGVLGTTRRQRERAAACRAWVVAAGAAAALLLLAVGLGLAAPPATSLAAPAAPKLSPQAEIAGLLVTLSATAEEVHALPEGSAGLVVRITLANQSGRDLAGLSLRASVPAGTRASGSWLRQPGEGAGTLAEAEVSWSGLALRGGERLGPFAFRLVPVEGADGARVFRGAWVRPEVSWSGPTSSRAEGPALRLNGLWGEAGLRRTLLPSGLTVFTRERPDTPTVSIRAAVRAGSRDEDDQTSGGSHWLEHAFLLGTRRRPTAQAVWNEIAAVGGVSNASTSWEYTDFWHLVPAEHFELALDVLADQLLNSTFAPEAFDRERRVVFEELKLRHDRPEVRATDEFLNLVFTVSPLRRHPAGTIQSVQSIPIETLLAYKERHYTSSNMAIAAVGNLRHDEAVARIEQAFAGLPRGAFNERPRTPEPPQIEPRRLEIGQDARSAELRLGWPAPGDDDDDSVALYVLNDILTNTGRRLSEEIRDRRALASAISSSYLVFSDAGAFVISATTTADKVDEVVERTLAEIRRAREGEVTDEEVAASLRAIAGRRALSDEPNQAQTGRAPLEVVGVLDSYDEYLARLRQVSAADVGRVARQYLDPDAYTLVVVRP